MIEHLESQVIERLLYYRANNPSKKLPNKIFYFRDGVSDAQWEQVNALELPKLRSACASVSKDPNYRPKIAIIVCGKRHHARFYPTNESHTDSKGNCAPGTVVDRAVTSVYEHDFYLQAHVGLQGTARSAHYIVTHDDIHLKADDLQKLVHNLSYLFARATKAVSYVPPAYYADILCERGRCYLQHLLAGRSVHEFSDASGQDPKAGRPRGGKRGGRGDAGGKSQAEKDAERKAKDEEQARLIMEEAKKTWGDGPKPEVSKLMFYV